MNINFGPLSADGDPNLLTYFHTTDQAAGIADFTHELARCIYVGRQGSGKTALTTWLASQDGNLKTVLKISPESHRIIIEGSEPTTADIRFMARLELMIEVGRFLVKNGRLTPQLGNKAKDLCEKGWLHAIGERAGRIGGASAFGFGLQLKGSERANYLRELRKDDRSANLQGLMKAIAAECRVMVVVDSPEDIIGQGTDSLSPENARRTGAILAALSDLHKSGIRVVCFLREQIYQMVGQEYDNSPHFEDQVSRLRWSSADLVNLLSKRVSWTMGASFAWSSLFEAEPDDFVDKVFPCLSSGPRDILYLINNTDVAGERVRVDEILAVRPALRRERMQNFTAQYRQWRSVDQVSTAIVDDLLTTNADGWFRRGQAQSIFKRLYTLPQSAVNRLIARDDWVNHVQAGHPTIEEVLFILGMLGFVDRSGTTRFPWENESIPDFNASTEYFVSPLFMPD